MPSSTKPAIRLGTAGWSYKDWEGIVYPKPQPKSFDPLAFLAGFVDCIEINSTFYHPPSEKNVKSWLGRIGPFPDFRFTCKLWQRFTHQREPFTSEEIQAVKKGTDPFMDSGWLAAVLVQFPWSFKNTEESRGWLDQVLNAFSDYPLVVEVRHASWNKEPFYEYLAQHGTGFVNIDQPLFKRSIKPSSKATAPIGYFRLHGQNYKDWFREDAGRDERYDYLYSTEELMPWAERIKDLSRSCSEVYVVTNNHWKGKALANALELKAMLTGQPVNAPESLVREYPRLARQKKTTN